jgi:ribonuclease HI
MCGAGAVLFIPEVHYFKIRYTPGGNTNTKADLSALWDLLLHATSMNLRKLQIFGDSKAVVDWVKVKIQMQVLRARNLME